MPPLESSPSNTTPTSGVFHTTHWSVVLAAGRDPSPSTQEAQETLCRIYWYPLYAFIRRNGHAVHDAQDLTQAFLARLIHRQQLQSIVEAGGRFRSFLLKTLKHFLSDQHKKVHAQKRGGGIIPVSIDEALAEDRYSSEIATSLSPEQQYDRRWAMAVMDIAGSRLENEYVQSGRQTLFSALQNFQIGQKPESTYASVANTLGITEGALKSAIYRFRMRHRELLREEVARTLTNRDDLDDEIRHLLSALS